ncbi:MAG: hypothetical protein ABF416_06710, partial [Zymomonas mobilis subsp. pomaceae]
EDSFFNFDENNNSVLENQNGFNFRFMSIVDQLRRNGIHLTLAHSHQEVATTFSTHQHVLLIEEGCLPSAALIKSMLLASPPAILSVKDEPSAQGFERIAASEKWGGLALIDGENLTKVNTIPDDWDLISTLMRQSVQTDCNRILGETSVKEVITKNDAQTFVLKITDKAVPDQISYMLLLGTAPKKNQNIFNIYLFPLLEKLSLPRLARYKKAGLWLSLSVFILAGLSLPTAFLGWLSFTVFLMMLAGLAEHAGNRLNEIQLRAGRRKQKKQICHTRIILAAFALILSSYPVSKEMGWGIFPLGTLIIITTIAADQEAKHSRRFATGYKGRYYLHFDYMIWIMFPFALMSHYSLSFWLGGLSFLTGLSILNYAAALQRFQKTLQKAHLFSKKMP